MVAIEIKDLTKKYKDKTAVNGLNLNIEQGELFALLGTNGAGKTTTIKMLSGLILPTTGCIKIQGMNMTKNMILISTLAIHLMSNINLRTTLNINNNLIR